MIGQLGFACLVIALALAVIQAIVPLYGAQKGIINYVQLARPVARLQFGFVLLSFILLVVLFLNNDFSIQYVWRNSSTILPWYYRITATWGSHEGSLLLWTLILAVWTLAVSVMSRNLPEVFVARVLSVMGFISIGFILFLITLSDPFAPLTLTQANKVELLVMAVEGRGLNSLLQDIGMIIHPPMLYMGYVGFCVAFAFAVAALIEGRLDALWARWSRPWTNIAWVFLTFGIALGSWWAYYELGWGGWWFWDPVENASFMPWLIGTALIHSLAVTEKRGAFQTWTLMLAIIAFSMSLLGTFLVRSGILNSVHSFTSDPARGVYILVFLVLVIGIPLVLYSMRAASIKSTGFFAALSRESFILINNVVFVVICAWVLLLTLFPILFTALGLGSVSIGPPIFNFFFVLFMVPLCVITVIAPQVKWKKDQGNTLLKKLVWPLVLSVAVIAITFLMLPVEDPDVIAKRAWYEMGPRFWVSLSMGLVAWIVINGLEPVIYRMRKKGSIAGGLKSFTRASWGMTIAHLGIAVFIVGAAYVSFYNESQDVNMKAGQHYTVAGYKFKLNALRWHSGPNYNAFEADFTVTRNGRFVAHLFPQKRFYIRQKNIMTEAGIDPAFTRDLFISMGDPGDRRLLGVLHTSRDKVTGDFIETVNAELKKESWVFRLQNKPMVRWIWLGALMMGLGGLIAAMDKRYRKVKQNDAVAT